MWIKKIIDIHTVQHVDRTIYKHYGTKSTTFDPNQPLTIWLKVILPFKKHFPEYLKKCVFHRIDVIFKSLTNVEVTFPQFNVRFVKKKKKNLFSS